MPIFVTPNDGFITNECNYENLEKNSFQEENVSTELLKATVDNFEKITFSNISAEEAKKLKRYANFPASKILDLLKVPGCVFLRVFNAVGADGNHFSFIAPVDSSGYPIKKDDAIYLAQCCGCPPDCIPGGGL